MTIFKGIYRPNPPKSVDYNILWKGHTFSTAKGVYQCGASYDTDRNTCDSMRKYWCLAIPEELL